MRLNPKVFELANGIEPQERQEFDGRVVEIYYMNDFDEVYQANCPKGKFALWTSNDGFNYRLFIEKGYYEQLSELYSDKVNKIWLDFWDKCDETTKKYNFKVMLPLALGCLIAYLLISTLWDSSAAIYVEFGILALFIVGLFALNKVTKNKLAIYNQESVNEIKKVTGSKHFDELMTMQKTYIDEYFEEQARLAEEEALKEEELAKEENNTLIEEESVTEEDPSTTNVSDEDAKVETATEESLEEVKNDEGNKE